MTTKLNNSGTASPEDNARFRIRSGFDFFSQSIPAESEITHKWDDTDEVVVSIACATFNQGNLLDDAIRSFLLQKTDFPFEIVIRDDASTDGTRDIIAHYMQHYPRIVRAQIYEENQFKLGRRPNDDWAELTSGKYIAICEGDDFWIDRDKLQDQVAQLERYPDAVISVAGTLLYDVFKDTLMENGLVDHETLYSDFPPQYHHTSTFLIEHEAFSTAAVKLKKYGLYGDTALRHLLVDQGKCICLPRVVSVYWVNDKGIWTSLGKEKRAKAHVLIFAGLIKAVGYRRKLSLVPSLLDACAKYFPASVRDKDWRFALACCVPFAIIKVRNVSRRVARKLHLKP